MATVQVEPLSPAAAEIDEMSPHKTDVLVGNAYCVDIVECEASYGVKNIDMVAENNDEMPPLKTDQNQVGTAYCVDIIECEASYGETNIDMVAEEAQKPSEEMIESEVNKNTTGL